MVERKHDRDAPEPLHPERLTWTALLGHWVAFARRSVALPDDDAGRRMRDSVPDVIMLQAVWFALRELDELAEDERPLGLDRAELLIDRHTGALRRRWRETAMPATMRELIDDARRQLHDARQRHADDGRSVG